MRKRLLFVSCVCMAYCLVYCSGAVSSDGLDGNECLDERGRILPHCDQMSLAVGVEIYQIDYEKVGEGDKFDVVCVTKGGAAVRHTRDRLFPMPHGFTTVEYYAPSTCETRPHENDNDWGGMDRGLVRTSELNGS